MSLTGKIFRSGKRYFIGSGKKRDEIISRYLSHHDMLKASDFKLYYAPDYYDKEKLQATRNLSHKAKKRIDSNTRTGKPRRLKKAPESSGTSAEGSEAAPDGSDVRSTKTGPRMDEQTTGGTSNESQTTGTDTTDKHGGGESSGAGQTLQSGGKYDPTKFLEMSKDNNLGRSERQMYGRLWNMRKSAQKVFNKGTDEQIKNELGRWGIEARKEAKAADYMKEIDEMLKKKAESGPTIGDKFIAHHGVGLTGLGVVGVSTLDLANSRGQQSNAQLYSDPFA